MSHYVELENLSDLRKALKRARIVFARPCYGKMTEWVKIGKEAASSFIDKIPDSANPAELGLPDAVFGAVKVPEMELYLG